MNQVPIFEAMKNSILAYDLNAEFKQLALTYLDTKKQSPLIFGELCLLHYREFCSNYDENIIQIASAMELLILGSDILDDLQDNDQKNSWCERYDIASNIAVSYFFLAMHIIANSNMTYQQHAIQLVHPYCLKSIQGQHVDLTNNSRSEEDYLQMIQQKSGALTALACQLGCVMATGQKNNRVEQYASIIGMIQQINNDLFDLEAVERQHDIIHKKYTLPIIYFLSCSNDAVQQLKSYYEQTSKEINLQQLHEQIQSSGAIHYTFVQKKLLEFQAITIISKQELSNQSKNYLKMLLK